MNVLYDHQIFTMQKYGGVSRYFTEIISHIRENVKIDIAIKYSNNAYLTNLKLKPEIEKLVNPYEKFLPNINFRGKRKLFNLLSRLKSYKSTDPNIFNKNLSIEQLKSQDFDIFHPTYYDNYFLEHIGHKPFVLTIYDMIHELYPEMINDPELCQRKAILAKKASHIIAISDQTKKDIIEILGIPENKISVIYLANSIQENFIKLELPKNYLLFVGERGFYKNFLFFASSIAPLLKKDSTLMIICTGRNFNQTELNYLSRENIQNRFLYKESNDRELFQLYKNAKAFIFPSHYEGFGLPILEAFKAGCPMILSNSSCFREIAGDAATYFSPTNSNELITAVETMLQKNDFRNILVQKGYEREKYFSWEKSAKETAELYRKVIEEFNNS